jgi:tetratricopeptide (TPR) repeat protein
MLGEPEKAIDHYREALRLDADLAEAHNALGNYYVRVGRYEDALEHFDRVVFSERKQGRTSAVTGWRVNVLFNLGEGRAAFREINGLVTQADRFGWIWPWCARLVAGFGRATVDNARQAAPFWQRYVKAHPEHSAARRSERATASSGTNLIATSSTSTPKTPHYRGIGWGIGPRMKGTGWRRNAAFARLMIWRARTMATAWEPRSVSWASTKKACRYC